MIVVLASFRMPEGSIARTRSLIPAVVQATLAEAGCHAYDVSEDVLEAGQFRVAERWESREALAAHMVAPHMAQWGKIRAELGMIERKVSIYDVTASETL